MGELLLNPKPGNQEWCKFRSESENLRTRKVDGGSSELGVQRRLLSQVQNNQSEFRLTLHFCSIQAFNGLDEKHPQRGGQQKHPNGMMCNNYLNTLWRSQVDTIKLTITPHESRDWSYLSARRPSTLLCFLWNFQHLPQCLAYLALNKSLLLNRLKDLLNQ